MRVCVFVCVYARTHGKPLCVCLRGQRMRLLGGGGGQGLGTWLQS